MSWSGSGSVRPELLCSLCWGSRPNKIIFLFYSLGVYCTASLPKIRDFWKCRHAPEDVPTFIIWAWRIRRWPPCKRKRPPCYAILRSKLAPHGHTRGDCDPRSNLTKTTRRYSFGLEIDPRFHSRYQLYWAIRSYMPISAKRTSGKKPNFCDYSRGFQ